MQFRRPGTAEIVVLLLLMILLVPVASQTYNITTILSKFPEFSTFSQYLTLTRLSSEINVRHTITVCAVDNSAMSQLLRKGLPLDAVRNLLSLHVILDYYDAKKLHQVANGSVQAATMFQASGFASGSSGIINITDLRGGKVGFGAGDNGKIDAYFIKSVEEIPYEISVIQISGLLVPRGAGAPSSQPVQMNVTTLMSARGCRVFAETLLRDSNSNRTFMENVISGLTIFCPLDDAFNGFLPEYNNLSAADKDSMLEYHGVPVYMSFSMLKSNNGVTNTLATDGAKCYQFSVQNDGNQVTLKTKIMTGRIMGKLIDRQPLAIFTIDKVLLPHELFKSALPQGPVSSISPSPSPMGYSESPSRSLSPSPSPSPKSSRRHLSPPAPGKDDFTMLDSPAESPEEEDDDLADLVTAAAGLKYGRFINTFFLCLLLACILITRFF